VTADFPTWLFLVFILANIMLTGWMVSAGLAILLHKSTVGHPASLPSFTLIVCTKNRLAQLRENLFHLLRQQALPDELIVVVDGSDDGTLGWLAGLIEAYPFLKILYLRNIPRRLQGKKAAMAAGLKAAAGPWILCTDDDCEPAGAEWTQSMLALASNRTRIVLGNAPLTNTNTFSGRFIRFDGFYNTMQYMGLAILGMPYMGVGRNLLYHKDVYRDAGGFEWHKDILSGDDDLLVNTVATRQNTAVNLDPEAFVWSPGKETWTGFFRQKRRHQQSGLCYKWWQKLILTTWNGSLILVYLLLVPVCLTGNCIDGLFVYVFFLFLRWITATMMFRKLGYPHLRTLYPVLEGLLAVVSVYLGAMLFRKPDRWS
jgi:glycosyltransferase involved in cell wall biosynthesis